MTTEPSIVIGKHYWLIFDGDRVPLILKAYNVSENGVIGGLTYNILTGETSFSKGFRPSGLSWGEFKNIPNEETVIEVRAKNIVEKIGDEDLAELEQIEKLKVGHFFSENVFQPFHALEESGL